MDEYEDDSLYRGDEDGSEYAGGGQGQAGADLPGTLEMMGGGRYKHSFHLPSAFYALIIGTLEEISRQKKSN